MEKIDKLYWENESISSTNYRLSCYNNLFGFPYMTQEKLLKVESSYQAYYSSIASNILLNPKIYSFIESHVENCSDINLFVTYIFSPDSSSNILLHTDKELIPFKKVNEYWFCLSPNAESPQLFLPQDLEKLIESVEGEKYLYDFKFDYFPISNLDNLHNLRECLQVTGNIIRLLVCKPNGQFIECFSYPDYPVKCLHEYIKSVTGYDNIRLIRKLSSNHKLIISDLSLPIKDIISPPSSSNLIFCELIKPSEFNI